MVDSSTDKAHKTRNLKVFWSWCRSCILQQEKILYQYWGKYSSEMATSINPCTANLLFFVGYQFSWLSWVGQSTTCDSQWILMCILKTSKPWTQDSTNFCFLPKSTKIGIHKLQYFHSIANFIQKYVYEHKLGHTNYKRWQIV